MAAIQAGYARNGWKAVVWSYLANASLILVQWYSPASGVPMLRKLTEGQRRTIAHWGMEFIVVVAGVLLALWLQERVAHGNRLKDALNAEAAIHNELDENLMGLVALESLDQCRRDRLREIDHLLRTEGATRPILSHIILDVDDKARISNFQRQQVYTGMGENFLDTTWRSANASGATSAIDPERYRAIASLYASFALLQQTIDTDRDVSAKLQLLAYGTPLSPDVRARLIEAHTIATRNWASFHDSGEARTARGVAKSMKKLGWNDKLRMDELIRRTENQIEFSGYKLKPCVKPLKNPFD